MDKCPLYQVIISNGNKKSNTMGYGVEMFNAYEHFPILSIKSLNLIGKVVKKLEKILADNLLGNNVEVLAYKL